MRYLVTSEEMKRYDKATIEKIGIPGPVLMERAALQTFFCLKERGQITAGHKVLILAGYGNNGGDGLVLARLLCEANMKVYLWLVGNEAKATQDFQLQKRIIGSYPIKEVSEKPKGSHDVIVDALFGVGLSRPLEGKYLEAIESLNHESGFKVAMDIPSGVSADTGEILGTAFRADLTVTYGFEKKGLYLYPGKSLSGEIVLADVGISKRSFRDDEPQCFAMDEDLQELLPKRVPDGNKGTFGKVLIVAGSYQMAGAAVLCSKACYRTGAGMVKILSVPENRIILQETLPEALLGNVMEEEDVISSLLWCDVICIGPGLGRGAEAVKAIAMALGVHEALTTTQIENIQKKPLILDADGLNLLTEHSEFLDVIKGQGQAGRQIVLTPHAGEFLRLWNAAVKIVEGSEDLQMNTFKRQPWNYARQLSKWLSVIVVAKDARTLICAPEGPYCMNLSGNSGMATAGSGDVLAGILSSFVAALGHGKALEPDLFFLAACRAVRAHGLLGDEAAKRLGEHAVMAGDLIP